MMSPKDNNDNNQIGNHESNKLNKISKRLITKTTKELNLKQQQVNAKTLRYFNKNLLVKPIINNNNNNDLSNTSIKASNTNDNNNKTCNLIVKMINDVSKSSTTTISGLGQNKQNDMAAAITTTTETSSTHTLTKNTNNGSEGGKNNKNNDFHNNNNNNLDNEQFNDLNKKMTNINEVYIESLSPVNERKKTLAVFKTKEEQSEGEREEFKVEAESFVTVKPTTLVLKQCVIENTTRHKNITNKPLNDSYQRAVDLETLKTVSANNSQCELLEFKLNEEKSLQYKDYPAEESELKFKSLAERKALLKKDFFKDFKTDLNITEKRIKKSELNKRILKKQHNLKLKIPSRECSKTKEDREELTKVDSLVALRKLDLQKQQQRELFKLEKNYKVLSKTQFPRVKELAKRFDYKENMILPQTQNTKGELKPKKLDNMMERNSPLSDEGCNIGLSPYSSDDDNDSIRTCNTAIERMPGNKNKDKVARSASSDSALGLEVDEPMEVNEQQLQQQQKRRMTLTVTDLPLRPALLPLAEPTLLPDSPLMDIPVAAAAQQQIPSKVLLEERVVEIPEDPRSGGSSRRESSQSCFSDYPPGEMQGVRFVRTPSVVVSDYSDDITCGITLEEIEYFRAQRLRRRRSSLETSGTEKDALDNNSDISASSSCSNLYYCGSTISALDGAECLVNGVRHQLERKTSDCSTCSVSGDEENNFSIPEQPEDCLDITDMLANQHLTNKRYKKVGITGNLLTIDNNLNNVL